MIHLCLMSYSVIQFEQRSDISLSVVVNADTNVCILQAQGSHLPLWLLWGRVVTGSHPAHLQVQLHRVIRLQLQHQSGDALRQAVWLPSFPLTYSFPNCSVCVNGQLKTFTPNQFDSPNCILLLLSFYHPNQIMLFGNVKYQLPVIVV